MIFFFLNADAAIKKHIQSDVPNLSLAANGILITLFPEEYKRIFAISSKNSKHIMFSYKHEHPSKEVMRALNNELREKGYAVWIDVDDMSKLVSLFFLSLSISLYCILLFYRSLSWYSWSKETTLFTNWLPHNLFLNKTGESCFCLIFRVFQ